MHQTLTSIQQSLEQLVAQVRARVPNDEPFGIAHGNWSFPGLTREELIEEAQVIIDALKDRGPNDLGAHSARLNDYIRRLSHLLHHTVPQIWSGNAGLAVFAYMATLEGLRKALAPVLTRDGRAEAASKLKTLTTQIRAMEARLSEVEPRTASVAAMVERIERAHNAADQLPIDLESLREAREKIGGLVEDAVGDLDRLRDIRKKADELDNQLGKNAEDAKAVLQRCETAYSAATSVGLAAAFSERSNSLSRSMWFWIAGLIAALATGSYFGYGRLHALSELFKIPDASASVIVLNLLLSLLSIGAPVWFAWLATKQIGQRFRLAEDYAFKASISRAYEGFRREAARFDKEMEARLLTSCLSRLDELPLRLVETASHGSPWHELVSSTVVKRAIYTVPNFAEQVKDLATKVVGSINRRDSTVPSSEKIAGS